MIIRVPVARGVGLVFGVFALEGEALGETLLGAVEVREGGAELDSSEEEQLSRGELHVGEDSMGEWWLLWLFVKEDESPV
jgi:hypothetical protein